jgi:hypothetical protein
MLPQGRAVMHRSMGYGDMEWVLCMLVSSLAQVKLLLGFHVPRHSSCLQTARYLAAHIRETVPLELGMGLAWLAVLLTMKHLGKTRRWAAQGSAQRPFQSAKQPDEGRASSPGP